MFRDSSEIAVAISVASPGENPTWDAKARPCWRATTMSLSALMSTTVSSVKVPAPFPIAVHGSLRSSSLSRLSVQVREGFLQVERRRDAFERQTQLDHREGDLRLDADDHGLGSAQPAHVREITQRTGREGVHHVQGSNIHDDAARTEFAHLRHQRLSESFQVLVVERRLDRRDQIVALLED